MDGSVESVEATLEGPVGFIAIGRGVFGDVPFAGDVGGVAGGLENLCDGDAFFVEVAAVSVVAAVVHHVSDACLMSVESSEKCGACGAASSGVIELGEAQAVGGKGVKCWRFDFAAVAADVGVSHVIGHDEDDVGTCVGPGEMRRYEGDENCEGDEEKADDSFG